jgi:hypothetical protein
MPFARSIASLMIGENDVFSCARSISLATITRLLWTTASVTGSMVIRDAKREA